MRAVVTERRSAGEAGSWGDIETLVRHWAAIGCDWVNLRFALDDEGRALVRYEAQPDGEPLEPDRRLPSFNGGFDTHRLMSRDEFAAHLAANYGIRGSQRLRGLHVVVR